MWGSEFTTKTEALQGDVDKFAPGLIRALTLVHSAQAFSRDSGLPDGLKSYYRLRNRGRMVRAADRRADLVPSEYEAKEEKKMRHLAPREAPVACTGGSIIGGTPKTKPKSKKWLRHF